MSRFVSAGTDADAAAPAPDDAWVKAQQLVESTRKAKKLDEGTQDGGKSLYEVLQANKAAKQEAFEESIRLKNQFRALDDDEVEFLDSVLEASRAKENAIKQETAEQLEVFRRQRAAAEQALVEGTEIGKSGDSVDNGLWAIKKKKRRREKDGESDADPKSRKLSTAANTAASAATAADDDHNAPTKRASPVNPDINDQITPPITAARPQAAVGLGLGAYSSDEDE
ncbi:uncharacterized protein Z519_08170 [Cladophialophora bantiana CBS 173.52]|uniref:FAM192A/Fyv6 N-terminal domain-containing protein n=1 Tax=Cladophialophora bantiana (strain ATCC 10958 / CBS 173.52 / CDC B-1940 / NIH 8579) TaxID=1442370 RepID=A0A0D2I2Y8_CLAB1|nr:uncharacterized protein Z519_08170 [Cladophialophora bantiana CBS 173.52]KIW91274.1 hypothetical protein Z519_08170 [Cladophialophora bantiana CBS 173.52]